MADANSSCEISERGKRRHRRKQNAKGRKKQMPNCLQRLPTRRNLDAQITNGTRQISRDLEIWRRNLKRLQIILGQITPCDLVFPSMRTSGGKKNDKSSNYVHLVWHLVCIQIYVHSTRVDSVITQTRPPNTGR